MEIVLETEITAESMRSDSGSAMDFKTFTESNRLRVKWNGVEHLVSGKYGELADMGDEGRFRLRLLAVPRNKVMNRTLLTRRRRALAAVLELRWKGDAESIFYFNPEDRYQVDLVIELVGAKRRRRVVLTPEQKQAVAARLSQYRCTAAVDAVS